MGLTRDDARATAYIQDSKSSHTTKQPGDLGTNP
jgi:hypothetical protein